MDFDLQRWYIHFGHLSRETTIDSVRHPPLSAESTMNLTSPETAKLDFRQIISMDSLADGIDFVNLHNILYFIYFGIVNLIVEDGGPKYKTLPPNFPSAPNPFDLYRNAEKLLLDSLKDRYFRHLKETTTTNNTAERLFHPDCVFDNDLRRLFMGFAQENFDLVKYTDGWKNAVCMEDDVSPQLRQYHHSILLEITQHLTVAPVLTSEVVSF
jgi:hypothetical protein